MAQELARLPAVIRPMEASDLDAVMEIGRLCFQSPWSREVFMEEMGRSWANLDVLRRTPLGGVVGYSNYWLVADEVHILNIATHPEARRCGHAAQMLDHIIEFARRGSCRLVTLEVRRSNEAAQRIYRRFNFKAVGLRPSYYADNNEDAVVMLLSLA